MSKIIKISQSDLEDVISKVIKEQMDNPESESIDSGEKLKLGQDQFGNFYVFDEDGNIIERTK